MPKIKNENARVCGKCRFFEADYNNSAPDAAGACRRHAPMPSRDVVDTIWPSVDEDAWCGEFQSYFVPCAK